MSHLLTSNIVPDQHTIRQAREYFNDLSKPFFERLADLHSTELRGYDENRTPIYSEAGKLAIAELYDHLEYLKRKACEQFGLPVDSMIPTIRKGGF